MVCYVKLRQPAPIRRRDLLSLYGTQRGLACPKTLEHQYHVCPNKPETWDGWRMGYLQGLKVEGWMGRVAKGTYQSRT